MFVRGTRKNVYLRAVSILANFTTRLLINRNFDRRSERACVRILVKGNRARCVWAHRGKYEKLIVDRSLYLKSILTINMNRL